MDDRSVLDSWVAQLQRADVDARLTVGSNGRTVHVHWTDGPPTSTVPTDQPAEVVRTLTCRTVLRAWYAQLPRTQAWNDHVDPATLPDLPGGLVQYALDRAGTPFRNPDAALYASLVDRLVLRLDKHLGDPTLLAAMMARTAT